MAFLAPEGNVEVSELGRCLVTGGSGYLGRSLATALVEAGATVRVVDVTRRERDDVEVLVGDVRSRADMARACEGIDTVFHTAARIETARLASPRLRREVWGVNVEGTRNLLEVARTAGVTRFVHTSSVNVVVDRPYAGGDESAPYATEANDLYTTSKAAAEALVLASDSDELRTCALRPGGIYGPGDPQHLPRVVRETLRGRFVALVGEGTARADNVYIDDLTRAHVAAANALGPEGRARGRAYFINDGVPTNYFHFFAPVLEQLGRPFPTAHVPGAWVKPAALAAEAFARFGGPRPFLTRMELDKLLWDHYFAIDRAKDELGWSPRVGPAEGFARCREWIAKLAEETDVVERPPLIQWIAVLGGLGLLGVLAFDRDAHDAWTSTVSPMLPQGVLRGIFWTALALHAGEAVHAYRFARKRDMDAAGWGLQTLLLGYPSLRLLHRAAARRAAR